MIGRKSLSAATFVVLSVAPCVAATGPITFNTALPVHDDELIVRTQVVWAQRASDPATLNVFSVPTAIVFGVHPRLTLFGVVPVHYKSLSSPDDTGANTVRSGAGLGDAQLFTRLTALALNAPGQTIRLAPFAGSVLPTGPTALEDGEGVLPAPLQPGTGAWDPFAGTVFTWQTLAWEWDTSVAYRLRTKVDGAARGDVVAADTSFQYRLLPWADIGDGLPNWLFGVAEINATWGLPTDAQDGAGVTVQAAPGLQWVTTRTVLEAAVQFPLIQPSDQMLAGRLTARLSFRINF